MQQMDLESIVCLCKADKLRWTNHVLVRLLQRNIAMDDIVYALTNCEIIEQYPEDYPYPSCLVLGLTKAHKHIRIVCGASNVELWLITAYYPDIEKWEPDYKIRRENDR